MTAHLQLGTPQVTGVALGLLNTLSFATAKRGLGVTTAFEDAAAALARTLAPESAQLKKYFEGREEPLKLGWESFALIGLLVGSHLSARAAGELSADAVPKLWRRRFGENRRGRYLTAFAGGALMMFGARVAKGCTSGHVLTGNAQLAVSSWVFTSVVCASALLTAKALYGKEVR